jgi:RNase H-fold protein (predicted Holliday junction resolvase)
MELLLAVDLGVKTGMALYRSDGQLLWYRSQNFGNSARLRKAIPALLDEDELRYLVVEGGGPLLKLWQQEAERKNIELIKTMAHQWRKEILYQREQRKGVQAKHNSINYAGRVIAKLSSTGVTSLTHDAAEAILIGLWAMHHIGWIKDTGRILHR